MMARMCYLTNFFLASALGVGFVFMADVQDRYGLRDIDLGMIVAAGFVAALATQLVLAPLADRGRVAALGWVAIVAGVVGTVGFAYADNVVTLIIARGLVGIGLGLFSVTAKKALIGLDIAGGGAKVGALLSTGVGGFVTGPVIGLAFGQISFAAPFLVVGLVIAIAGPIAVRLTATVPIAVADVDYADVGNLLRLPGVQVAILVQLIVFGFIGLFDAVIDRYLTDLGASDLVTTIAILAVGLPLLVLPTRLGALAERVGGARVLLPGVFFCVVTMTLFGFVSTPLLIGAVGLFQGIGESSTMMGGQMLVLESTRAERAAIGSAILETVGLSAATITSLLAPITYGSFGERWLFGGYGMISAVIAAAIVFRIWTARTSFGL